MQFPIECIFYLFFSNLYNWMPTNIQEHLLIDFNIAARKKITMRYTSQQSTNNSQENIQPSCNPH